MRTFMPKFKLPMLKHSGQRTSTSFTMLFIAFNITILWLVLYIFGVPFVPDFSAAEASILLSPLYTLYFMRRWNENKTITKTEDEQ